MSITYSERVFVALFIQHAKRMRRVVLSTAASPALQYFSTLSQRRHDFRERKSFYYNLAGCTMFPHLPAPI